MAQLNEKGMRLNRDLKSTVTVRAERVDFSEFVEIVINYENLNLISDVDILKIVIQSENEFVALPKESIEEILNQYKEFKIQLKKLSGTYTVRFLDSQENIIGKYGTNIKISLPAEHSEQTVYLFADNKQENWGGQFNSVTQGMEFVTRYSGEYNVSSPEIVINDIESLSEYEKQAIRFMVVRGYFGLDENSFGPYSPLTRYDFAESLVRMFFALDDDAQCSFTDIDEENYRYVAASQNENIVQGFSDGTFRGNENVTVEQVVALTARTINKKNGYVYPENIEKYLNFTDDNVIHSWAKKEVALTVREGIYSSDMELVFSRDITRKDAAVMLYRLFMILNNTPKADEQIKYSAIRNVEHKTLWNKTSAIVVVSAIVFADVMVVLTSVFFVRKKRKRR